MHAPSLLAAAAALLTAVGGDAGPELRTARPAPPSGAPAAAADTSPEDLRVGLALSGGGARGLAHLGVLRVLEDAGVRVDAVAGTSMGAVVGGLYAAGHRAAGLDSLARSVDWTRLFGEQERPAASLYGLPAPAERHQLALPVRRWRPTLPSGLIAGQGVTQLLSRRTWRVHDRRSFLDLPIPFMAVATDVETGEPVRLTSGSLPVAIRASMAIPSIFTPVEIGNRALIDGGVSRSLPATEVRSMGVDRVVCSDVTEPPQPADSLNSFLDVLKQTMSYRTDADVRSQREHCDVLIRPDLSGMDGLDFTRPERRIERGERAARGREAALRRLAARQVADAPRPPPPAPEDSVMIAGVEVPDLPPDRAAYLTRLLDLPTSRPTTVARVDRAVERLYSVGVLARVSYLLDGSARPDGSDGSGARRASRDGEGPPTRTLVMQTEPRGRDELRVGVRATSHENAAVLLSTRFHHTTGFGSITEADVRLGDELLFELRHRMRPLGGTGLVLSGRTGYRRTPAELTPPGGTGPRQDLHFEQWNADLFAGPLLAADGIGGVEAGVEWYEEDPEPGESWEPAGGWLGRAGGLLRWDSRERTAFPRSGVRLRARADRLVSLSEDGPSFSQLYGEASARVPLGARWSLWAEAALGATGGDPPPLNRQFFLGGALESYVFPRHRITLPGLRVRELRGSQFQKAGAGLQVEIVEDVFLQGAWAAGQVQEEWRWAPSAWEHGGRITAGSRTPLGIVKLTLAEATTPGGPRLELDLGGRF